MRYVRPGVPWRPPAAAPRSAPVRAALGMQSVARGARIGAAAGAGAGMPFTSYAVTTQAGVASQLIGERANRRYLLIQNKGLATVYIAVGRDPTAADIEIPPGGSWEPWIPPGTAVYGLSANATQVAMIDG